MGSGSRMSEISTLGFDGVDEYEDGCRQSNNAQAEGRRGAILDACALSAGDYVLEADDEDGDTNLMGLDEKTKEVNEEDGMENEVNEEMIHGGKDEEAFFENKENEIQEGGDVRMENEVN